MVIARLWIKIFAAVASRSARLFGRMWGEEGILDEISSAVSRAFRILEGR